MPTKSSLDLIDTFLFDYRGGDVVDSMPARSISTSAMHTSNLINLMNPLGAIMIDESTVSSLCKLRAIIGMK